MECDELELRYWLLIRLTVNKSTEISSDWLIKECGGDHKRAALTSLAVIQDLLGAEKLYEEEKGD